MLDQLGYTLVDCPGMQKKEAADKKIIVDACFFGATRAAQARASAVVLVTGDGDFCHMVSRLRAAGVLVAVVHPAPNQTSSQARHLCYH